METGAELIAKERSEQIHKHLRTVEKDYAENCNGELLDGAVALLNNEIDMFPDNWSHEICEHMVKKDYKERLIIAGALLAAEIDRLIYAEKQNKS